MKRYRRFVRLLLLATLGFPAAVTAQQELAQRCAGIPVDPTRRFCNLLAEAIEIAQPRIGLALTGGNPLPGAASTLGMRLGALPRVSVAARVTGVKLDLPPIEDFNSNTDIDAFLPALNIDAAVGVYSGLSLLPTVGGFASLDLVASVGTVPIPNDDGFQTDRATSWAVGARLGILRESFTAPGISVTALYRRFGDISFGDRQLVAADAYFESSGFRVLSLRGVVGKRLLVIGATAGLGYDRYQSDLAFGVSNPGIVGPARFDFRQDDFASDRVTAFGSLQWTMLILSIVGEVGWQSGGDEFLAPLPSGRSSASEKGAYYGSFAVRVAI